MYVEWLAITSCHHVDRRRHVQSLADFAPYPRYEMNVQFWNDNQEPGA